MDYDDREEVYLRVNLKDVPLKRFRAIKEHLGFEADSEVVRYLILQEYLRIFGDS